MKLMLYYVKKYYEKYRLFIFLLLILLLSLIPFLMVKKIVVGFPDKTSDNYYLALSQLYGGALGGLLTLIGVSITIFYTNYIRRKDLQSQDKPILLFDRKNSNSELTKVSLSAIFETNERHLFKREELNSNELYCSYKPFNIYVTSNADCILEEVIISEKMIYPLEHRILLKKDKIYSIDLSDYYFKISSKTIPDVTLCVSSMNEKKYYYTLSNDESTIKEDRYFKVKFDDINERINGFDKKMNKLFNELDFKSGVYISNLIKEKRSNKGE